MRTTFPLGPSQPLVVPVELSSDLDREGPIAARIAERFGADIELVTILGTEDFVSADFLLFAEQADRISETVDIGVTMRVIVSEQLPDAFLSACSGRVTCMTTSASPFKRQHFVDSFAATLVANTTQPVILIGPSVPTGEFFFDRVIAAVSHDPESRNVLPAARAFAEGLGVPLQRVFLHEQSGTFYTTSFSDAGDCLPTEIHAAMGSEKVVRETVADTIVHRSAAQILAVATRARQGLAWIADGSVAFDLVEASPGPVLVVGPNLGRTPTPPVEVEGNTIDLEASTADAAYDELENRLGSSNSRLGQIIYRPSRPSPGGRWQ